MAEGQAPMADQCLDWIPAHGGPVARWEDTNHYSNNVSGDGLEGWWHNKPREGTQPRSCLQRHTQTEDGLLMLEICPRSSADPNAAPIWWSASLMVGKGRYVRQSGDAKTIAEALATLEALRYERRLIGGLTWWQTDRGSWLCWLGQYALEAHRHATALDNEQPWYFQITGSAHSFEEAALLAALGRLQGGADA